MTSENTVQVAENLEMFGTSRAHFGHLSDEERERVAQRINIHLTRQRVDGPIMEWERPLFFHICGDVGIEYDEARTLWRNATEMMQWSDINASRED